MTRYPDIARVVQRFVDALEAGDLSTAGELLDDSFVFRHRALGEALDKQRFLALARDLHAAFPDLDYHPQLQAIGDRVDGELRLTGTHRGPLRLAPVGAATVPPTGKSIALPQEHASWTVHGGKIVRHDVDSAKGGGFEGIFAQLRRDAQNE